MAKLQTGLLVALSAVFVFYITRKPPINVTHKLLDHYDYIVGKYSLRT